MSYIRNTTTLNPVSGDVIVNKLRPADFRSIYVQGAKSDPEALVAVTTANVALSEAQFLQSLGGTIGLAIDPRSMDATHNLTIGADSATAAYELQSLLGLSATGLYQQLDFTVIAGAVPFDLKLATTSETVANVYFGDGVGGTTGALNIFPVTGATGATAKVGIRAVNVTAGSEVVELFSLS